MTRTLCVEGDITAVDTATNLVTQGSVTTPSRQVPTGVTRIKTIMGSFATDAAAAGENIIFVRLTGSAILGGAQTIMVGATANIAVQSGADGSESGNTLFLYDGCDIAVRAGDTIDVQAEMAGVDNGTISIAVGLVFA